MSSRLTANEDTLKRYGMDNYKTAESGAIAQGRTYNYDGTAKDRDAELIRRVNSDAQTQNALLSSAMSGKKKAQKFLKKGIKNVDDVQKLQNMQRKQHEQAGNGGSFSSYSDFSGLMLREAEKDREQMLDGIKVREPKDVNAIEPAGPSFDDVESDAVRENREEVEAFEEDMSTQGDRIFGGSDVSDASGFSDAYKLNVMRGLELSGKKTRGPESGLTPGAGF